MRPSGVARGRARGGPRSGSGQGATDFADNLQTLGGLYGDDGFLYAPQDAGGGAVYRVAKQTGATDILVTIAGSPPLRGVDIIDGAFYFTEATAGSANDAQIFKLVIGETVPTVYASSQRNRLFGITHDASTVYLVSQGPSAGGVGGIVQTRDRPLVGKPAPQTSVTGLSYPIGAQVYNGYIYIAEAGTSKIVRAKLGTDNKEDIASCPFGGTYGLSIYNDSLYYSCVEANQIRAVAIPLAPGSFTYRGRPREIPIARTPRLKTWRQ